ncbi:MAG TPA: hypothetical protein PLU66_09225, partial [Trueperaceae bacterium]|nr:hypothetical protein [Trueperaceae bacterium]
LRVVVEPWWRMTGDRNVQVAFVVSGLLLLAAMVVFLLAMSKRVVTLATIREKGLGRRRSAAPQEGESGEKD